MALLKLVDLVLSLIYVRRPMLRNKQDLLKLILACGLWTGFVLNVNAQDLGGGSLTLTGAGTGSLTLNGGNTYTGGTLIVTGGTLIGGGAITVNGGGILTPAGDGALTLDGSSDDGFTLGENSGGNTITVAGTGPGILTGVTLTGGLNFSDIGTLTLNSGTLGSLAGNLVVTSGGTFTVVDTDSLPSSLTLGTGSTLQLNIDTSTAIANTLSIAGNLTLDDPNLIVTDLADPQDPVADGTTFDLIHYDGTETGEFVVNGTSIPEDGTFTLGDNEFKVDYAAGDPNVMLTAVAVPEPSAWMMVIGGVCFLAFLRRRVTRANS
jgi:hypothetical protein